MVNKFFKNRHLLLMGKFSGQFSLFKTNVYGKVLEPVEYAQNAKKITVFEDVHLVAVDECLYMIDTGHCICVCDVPHKQIRCSIVGSNALIEMHRPEGFGEPACYLMIWDGKNIIFNTSAEKVLSYNGYFTIQKDGEWVLYSGNGQIKAKMPVTSTTELPRVSNDSLIIPKDGEYVIASMLAVKDNRFTGRTASKVCSSSELQFFIYRNLSGSVVTSFFEEESCIGGEEIEDFGIVHEKLTFYFTKKGGKYFLYDFGGAPYDGKTDEFGNAFAFDSFNAKSVLDDPDTVILATSVGGELSISQFGTNP